MPKKRKMMNGGGKTDRSEEEAPPPADDSKPEAAAAAATVPSDAAAAAASSEPAPVSTISSSSSAWMSSVIAHIPRCRAAEGIRETSSLRTKYQAGSSSSSTRTCLRKLLQELATLEDSLPAEPAIWLRYDEETPQFARALIAAPAGTPYAHGLFAFDLFFPDAYPATPPKVKFLTTGGGTLRFSPNLYENGTVCLSLLGTWNGPRWNPQHSTVLQLLVSIQGLILGVEHPYYLEPGHGGWEGDVAASSGGSGAAPATTVPGYVKTAEDQYRVGTVKYAMLETCRATAPHLAAFRDDVIAAHFAYHQHVILRQVKEWAKTIGRSSSGMVMFGGGHPASVSAKSSNLQEATKRLEAEFAKLPPLSALAAAQDDGTAVAAAAVVANGGTATNGGGGSSTGANAKKREAMEEAAGKGDYITAGQLQSELHYLEHQGVEAEILAKSKEMDDAAAKNDFITAGQLQQRVQYLEKHKKRLQELQKRMFQSAAQQDFIRAGRFQEQYQILLDSNEPSSSSTTVSKKLSSATANAAAAAAASMGPNFGGLFGAAMAATGPSAYDDYGDGAGPSGAPGGGGGGVAYFGPPPPDYGGYGGGYYGDY